jgi:hypothetical protein
VPDRREPGQVLRARWVRGHSLLEIFYHQREGTGGSPMPLLTAPMNSGPE